MDDYLLHPDKATTFKKRCALKLLRLFKWRVHAPPLPGPRGVLIFYPHTSNWDFALTMLAKWSIGMEVRWLVKDSLFGGIFGKILGPILRSWGGEPIERNANAGNIERLAKRFHAAEWFWLALSPEGTRKYRPAWRSGFYYIALAAKVPIALGFIDYSRKECGIAGYYTLTGDKAVDMAAIRVVYEGMRGLHHDLASPIDLQK